MPLHAGHDKLLRVIVPRLAAASSTSYPTLPITHHLSFRRQQLVDQHLGKWQPTTTSEAHHGTGWRPGLTGDPVILSTPPNRSIQTSRPSLRPSLQLPQRPHPYNHPQPMIRISPTSFPARSNPVQPISTNRCPVSPHFYHLGCGQMLSYPLVTMACLARSAVAGLSGPAAAGWAQRVLFDRIAAWTSSKWLQRELSRQAQCWPSSPHT